MEEVRRRIKIVLSSKNLTVNKIAGEDKALQNRMNRQINQDSAVSAEVAAFVLEICPDISAEWLMRGVGTMQLQQHQTNYVGVAEYSPSAPSADMITLPKSVFETLQQQLEEKDRQISALLAALK